MKVAILDLPGYEKEKRIYCPIAKQDFENQVHEIFKMGHYKAGRRKKNAVYLDVGANIGLASLYFRKWAKHIYALEPSKECFNALVRNTEEYDNISCHNYAIFPKNAQQESFFKVDPASTAQTFFPEKEVIYREHVDCITLESFMNEQNIDHVDVMKIDVENSEYVIFPSGGFARVSDRIDFIVGEAHFSRHGFPEIVPEMLADYGYTTKFLEFKPPNMKRGFNFLDIETKKKRHYEAEINTIFIAWRENADKNR